MKYPKLSTADVQKKDFMNQGDTVTALDLLMNMPINFVTPKVTAGAQSATVTENVLAAPTKSKVARARFIIDTVQTGASNTPTINLINTDDSNAVIGKITALALLKSAGDVIDFDLDADHVALDEGDVVALQIVNTDGTITVALAGKAHIELVSVV